MFKKISLFVCSLLMLSLVLCGCARKLIVAEVLQQPEDGKIYTKCNIWYTDAEDIYCLNYQSGKILPLGTEVEIVDATAGKVIFKDMKGKEYRINIDEELIMIPSSDYVAQIFTLKTLDEQTKGISTKVKNKIIRGIVTPKMTKAEVILTYGPPMAFRTPSQQNSTWLYFINRDTTKRIVFRGKTVKTILKFDGE
jgi:hypothetical protein